MLQINPTPERKFQGRLSRTMLLVLIPLSLVLLLGGVIYIRASGLLTEQIESQLTRNLAVLSQKTDEWITTKRIRLDLAVRSAGFSENIYELLEINNPSNPRFISSREYILARLNSVNRTGEIKLFNHFLLLSPDGKVIISTVREWEGINLSNTDYFPDISSQAISIALNAPKPLYDENLFYLTSQPYRDGNSNIVATVIGVSPGSSIRSIFEEVILYNPSAQGYFITKNNDFIGIDPVTLNLTPMEASSEQIDLMPPLKESHIYDVSEEPYKVIETLSFLDESVLAVYTWLPSLQSGLVLEYPTSIILGEIQKLAPFTVVILIASIFLLGFLLSQGSRRIVRPLLNVANVAQGFAAGDWDKRAEVNRNDEIGLLAYSFNRMADDLSILYRDLENQVDARSRQIRTAAEVAQLATSSSDLDTILRSTVDLIVERFGYYHAAIYLVDRSGEKAILREATGEFGELAKNQPFELAVGSRSIVGWVTSNNRPWVAPDVNQDPFYLEVEYLPDTKSEVGIPLSVGPVMLGVLDVQSSKADAFDEFEVATLQTLADQIASTIQNIRLLEAAQFDLQSTNLLYQASHDIAHSETREELFQSLTKTLKSVPYSSALLIAERNGLRAVSMYDPGDTQKTLAPSWVHISPNEIELYLSPGSTSAIYDIDQARNIPAPLLDLPRKLGCKTFALLPIKVDVQLAALIILGSEEMGLLTPGTLEPYNSLVEMVTTALEKVSALQTTTQRLAELQTLNTVSQSISTETKLTRLFEIIHQQIIQVMGNISFLIALYNATKDTIEVPYMDDGEGIVSVPPFPLGEGLTSILIRTRQPLMILEDAENRSRVLGAKVIGEPAKSWLGVPLLIGGEVIGAIVVQDLEHEHRFNDDDLRLLTTMAAQVAVAIRNVRLFSEAQKRSEHDRLLYDITSKIRRSVGIEGILATTATELGKALRVRRASINIDLNPTVNNPVEDIPLNNQEEIWR